jgi:hypothetical protein
VSRHTRYITLPLIVLYDHAAEALELLFGVIQFHAVDVVKEPLNVAADIAKATVDTVK